ncbi:MAG TPA: hypothetical protein EYN51_08940 [Flavobacteriales bacterium]|nr:hypothetical protein [Flavobacteriales bacterium]
MRSNTNDPNGFIVNATTYSNQSAEARFAETKTLWIPGFTVKGGLNYNLSKSMNAFFNLGYISKAPRYNNVVNRNNEFYEDLENEKIIAFELGYSYKNPIFATNLNAYYTIWKNKPLDFAATVPSAEDPEIQIPVNINGIDAVHMGAELDFVYKIFKGLDWEGVISLGSWKWASGANVDVYDQAGNYDQTIIFDAEGIFVGDAAQTQLSSSLKYTLKDKLLGEKNKAYLKFRGTYFARNYSNFDFRTLDKSSYPNSFDADGNPRQSWQMPNYFLMDLHAGYGFNIIRSRVDLRFSLLNVLNTFYISDAQNNDSFTQSYNDFDAKSASVFVGMPTRYALSLKITI